MCRLCYSWRWCMWCRWRCTDRVDDVCDVDVDDVGDVGNVMQMKWNECGKNYLGDPWQELSGKNEGLCASWKSLKGLSRSQTLCGTYEYWDWAAWSFGISCCIHARISSTSFIFTHSGKILLTHHHPNLDAAIAIRYTTVSCKTP